MENHFARLTDLWPPGREDYHWHLLPDPQQAAGQLTGPYRELTHRPALAPVRPQWCHLTVQDVAPVDALSGREIADITGLVRAACAQVAPFALTIGPAKLWRGGIVCPATPADPVRRLWDITTGAARQITGDRFPTRPAVCHPHLSLAYGLAQAEDGPLRAWLSGHDGAGLTVTVDRLVLVAQRHDEREITWRAVDAAVFGS